MKFTKNSTIYVSGHEGMVGKRLIQYLTKKDNPKFIRYTTGFMIGISEAFAISCVIWWDLFLVIVYLSLFFLYIGTVGLIVYLYSKKYPKDQQQFQPYVLYCYICGDIICSDYNFCRKCGTKLK